MPSIRPLLRGLLRSSRSRFSSSKSTPPSPPPPLSPSKTTSSSTSSTSNPNGLNQPDSSWIGHPFRVVLTAIKFVACAHLLWEYGVSMAPASGPSMLPTFEVLGEWLLVSKLHRFGRGITVGDVVAYSIPINEDVGVKRVLGLPGDYVLMDTPVERTVGGSMIQVSISNLFLRPWWCIR